MKNDKTRLSASEINKFTYCPYQWYYRRYYGESKIRQIYNELGLQSSKDQSYFKKGNRYHRHYYIKYRLKMALYRVGAVFLVILMIGMVIKR